MINYNKLFFYCLLLSASSLLAQQKQANIWYFGYKAGLDFNGGGIPTALINGQMDTWEGCSSISDINGNLLFYTDGSKVWDKNHTIMPNGSDLMGDNSSVQSAFIASYVGDKNKYYVFTTDGKSASNSGPLGLYDGLKYSVIDMSLNAGAGDIVPGWKNRALVDSTTEQVTAALHSNGIDYWVITRKQFSTTYYTFLVTCNGIDTANPVITTIGNTNSLNVNPFTQAYLKASPSGTAIVSGFSKAYNELYDFDRSSGRLSNARILSTNTDIHYGVAFSPNDSIIYIGGGESTTKGRVYRYNRFAPSIPASEQITSFPGLANIGAIQLAPDGKLYFTHPVFGNHADSLGVIQNPNNFANPGIVYNHIYLQGKLSGYGLPSFFDASFFQPPKILSTSFICLDSAVAIGSLPIPGMNYFWTPTAGLSNPTISNPIASPVSGTLYILGAYNSCDTIYDSVFVMINYECLPSEEIFYIPNTFSPNGDGLNDTFYPKSTGIEESDYELLIFDRWGNLIWHTNTLNEGWDGRANGGRDIAQMDVYVWKCKTKEVDTGKKYDYIGHVNLLR